ncbi:uridine diphosphate-N-acetylglucosamine-binding protein YvcK [Candidatus Bipolaricaulota bacterium]|nr:uridine diphosphate-N-acetylglucosamine-binding protein YvcK [Candidatus Bipolaricaulota bacterium]
MNWNKLSKWFYPGTRIKRWGALGIFSGLMVGFSLILLIGGERIGALYDFLSSSPIYYYLAASFALLGGILGLIWAVSRLALSVTGPLNFLDRSPSNLILRSRLLDRGPKVVTIGGGTGLSVLLRGLKQYTSNITAIVTVMDDGGSSGRLRREMDMLPPGDIRNCLIALADDESWMSKIFQHRFENGSELGGHSLGNLIIAGVEQIEGSFERAIEETSKLLNIRGRVIPSTLKNTNLVARLEGGEVLSGESSLSDHPKRIERIELEEEAPPYPPAIEEIKSADVIVLGPGSLFTSLVPNLLVNQVGKAVEEASGKKFYVANIMTEPGETDGFSATDHLEALGPYLNLSSLDYVVVNVGKARQELLDRYAREGAELVEPDLVDDNEYGVRPLLDDLVDTVELEGKRTVKHDHGRLAKLVLSSLD